MLSRLVRQMQRRGSLNNSFVRRIPTDARTQALGKKLAGDETIAVTITPRTASIRVSLRTTDPAEVKARQAGTDAYLENVWRSLRQEPPIFLEHRQATAPSGELYRTWASATSGSRTLQIGDIPGRPPRLERGTVIGPEGSKPSSGGSSSPAPTAPSSILMPSR